MDDDRNVDIAVARNRAAYDSFWEEAPDFARYNPGARHRRRLIARVASRARFDSFLDVGCGDGQLVRALSEAHPRARAAGADLSPVQIERNRARMPGVDFFALDIQREKLDRTFDLVVCSEVIEHVADQRRGVANLAAMVAPRGSLVLTCPTGAMYATERRFGHVHHPTPRELETHAKDAGLRLVEMLNWGFPFYRIMKWATNVNVEFAMKSFASGPYTPWAKAVSNALYWMNLANRDKSRFGCQIVALFTRA
jgi:SAM-dependent methyltransferase